MYTLKVEDPNKLYFTSDSHFNHPNIIRYCHRPYETGAEMMKDLIEKWNSVVPEDGIVVHCGDFIMAPGADSKEYARIGKKLNGTIYLLRGNHDRINLGERTLSSFNKNYIPIEGEPVKFIVNDMMRINVDGVAIFAQHYPCLSFNGDYQVFGHIHTESDGLCHGTDSCINDVLKKNQYDVGVDQNGFRPISYWELCDKFLERSNK